MQTTYDTGIHPFEEISTPEVQSMLSFEFVHSGLPFKVEIDKNSLDFDGESVLGAFSIKHNDTEFGRVMGYFDKDNLGLRFTVRVSNNFTSEHSDSPLPYDFPKVRGLIAEFIKQILRKGIVRSEGAKMMYERLQEEPDIAVMMMPRGNSHEKSNKGAYQLFIRG